MKPERVPERHEVPAGHRWDLSPLFGSESDWEALFSAAEHDLEGYAAFVGRLGGSAQSLRAGLEFHLDLTRRVERLATYAHLRSDEDRAHPHHLGMHQRAALLGRRVAEAASFIPFEIQTIPEETLARFMADPPLAPYRFYLEKILRRRPHTRPAEEERLLAMSRDLADASSSAFGQLDNVDLTFGVLTDARGTRSELSHGNFMTFMSHPDRGLRRRAFFQYYRAYDRHRHTLAALLAGSVRKDVFYARARRFESCRAAALFPDSVPEAVYDNLVATVRDGLETLCGYFELRRTRLELPRLHIYDTYVPISAPTDFRLPYEEAVALCVRALAPLGEEYTSTLEAGLLGGWVDRYENRGKRSGAYASGCYDSPPYILLNYDERTLNSLYTLAHEAGHAMHSHYARRHRPYVDHDYSIFVAEVASTFNEALLSRFLLEHFRGDRQKQMLVLNREIDAIRGTLFRQTMFAEFELDLHRRAEANQPLTLEAMSGLYRGLLGVYFGDAVVLDDALWLEYLRIPHFYSAFYVYKYATGIAAALALAEGVAAGGAAERQRYLGFLALGGSRFPIDALRAAGVDMRTPGPVAAAIGHFGRRVAELGRLSV